MRIEKILLGLAVCCLTSAGSLAADYDIANDIALVETYGVGDVDWTGFYFGVLAGYEFGKFDSSTTTGTSPTSTSIDGITLGITGGVNYQIEQFVLGAEADVAWSGVTGHSACDAGAKKCINDLNWGATLRARAGIAVDQVLVYGTAGLAIGNGTSTTSPAAAATTGADTQTFVGWVAGAGIEYAIDENLSVKGEYLYTDLGTRTSAAGTVGNVAFNGSPITHAVKVGLNYSF